MDIGPRSRLLSLRREHPFFNYPNILISIYLLLLNYLCLFLQSGIWTTYLLLHIVIHSLRIKDLLIFLLIKILMHFHLLLIRYLTHLLPILILIDLLIHSLLVLFFLILHIKHDLWIQPTLKSSDLIQMILEFILIGNEFLHINIELNQSINEFITTFTFFVRFLELGKHLTINGSCC